MSEKMEGISESADQRISALTTKAHEGLAQRRAKYFSLGDAKAQRTSLFQIPPFGGQGVLRRDAETQSATNRKSSIANRLLQILHTLVPILLLFVLAPTSLIAQHRKIDWDLLAKVEWSEKYSVEHDEMFYYPKFGKEVLALNGQPVQIKGYVIPVDVETGYFVLSANPFASCFFCGQAGPESILELQLKEGGKKFKTDDVRTFKGTLRLNYEDLMHCNYILENAEVVK